MNYLIYPLFSKPLYFKKINIDRNKILKMIDDDFEKASIVNDSNVSERSNCTTVLNKRKFKFLKNILMNEFDQYNKEVLHYKNNFKMTTSWFTRTHENQGSNYHNHVNSFISGVLYLNCDDSAISFENFQKTKLFHLIPKKYNIYNSDEYTIKVSNCSLIFFPSETYHRIVNNNSNVTRYSLAFNLIPVGEIGDKKSDSFVEINIK